MAGHAQHNEHAGHWSADDQYLETPPGAGYEHTDASVGVMVKFAFWLAVSAVIVHLGLAAAFVGLVRTQMQPADTRAYPLATDTAPRLPAAPRLQQIPENEMVAVRRQQDQDLHSYGWIDKDAGIVHIPIEDGMRLLLERGLPTRDQTSVPQAGQAGMMPSDSSSGRVLERRRQ